MAGARRAHPAHRGRTRRRDEPALRSRGPGTGPGPLPGGAGGVRGRREAGCGPGQAAYLGDVDAITDAADAGPAGPDRTGRAGVSPSWARTSGPARRCASRWRRCGWPPTTRRRRPMRSRRCWTARSRGPPGADGVGAAAGGAGPRRAGRPGRRRTGPGAGAGHHRVQRHVPAVLAGPRPGAARAASPGPAPLTPPCSPRSWTC